VGKLESKFLSQNLEMLDTTVIGKTIPSLF